MDLIMGSFSEDFVPAMSVAELDSYEEILQAPDPDVYEWVSGQKAPPANLMNPVLEKLLSHSYATSHHTKRDS